MRKNAVQYLVCPSSGAALQLEVFREEGDHVLEGQLISTADPTCRYPITGGIPRFVEVEALNTEQRDTVDTFSYKWSKISNYAYDQESKAYREGWYYERFNFPAGDPDVQKFLGHAEFILEAGTGTGVDTDMLVRNSDGLVFGIDISTAINTAFERFKENPRIILMQADIGNLPFRREFFDVISCDQVLHHTPNPPENFGKLASLLKPSGKFLLYVYKVKGAIREFSDNYLRDLYVSSPLEDCIDFSERIARFGRNLAALNVNVTIEDDLPELGIKQGTYNVQRLIYDHVIKCYWNDNFDFETNVMTNFDWYRPLHAYRYTPEEIEAWSHKHHMQIVHTDVSPSGISTIMVKQS